MLSCTKTNTESEHAFSMHLISLESHQFNNKLDKDRQMAVIGSCTFGLNTGMIMSKTYLRVTLSLNQAKRWPAGMDMGVELEWFIQIIQSLITEYYMKTSAIHHMSTLTIVPNTHSNRDLPASLNVSESLNVSIHVRT
jgi:hypothetical protein